MYGLVMDRAADKIADISEGKATIKRSRRRGGRLRLIGSQRPANWESSAGIHPISP